MFVGVREELARGYVLLGVLQIHSLIFFIGGGRPVDDFILSAIQVKLLAPQVAVFFFLNGMAVPKLGRKSARTIAVSSLMLVVLAAVSHVVGVALSEIIYGGAGSMRDLLREIFKPIVYGTGYCTFVAWFFVVLAAVRVLAYIFERNRMVFAAVAVALVGLVLLTQALHLPDNLYEWRNWPAALLFFLVGMRINKDWQVPAWLGAPALPVALLITWFNTPDVLQTGLCWDCNLGFVSQPMVGQYGFFPLYVAQVTAFLLFVLWIAQVSRPAFFIRIIWLLGLFSLHFLLLHGWVIVVFYPLLSRILPAHESVWTFFVLLVMNPVAHALLFFALKPLLDRILAGCFAVSRLVVDLIWRLDVVQRKSRPAPLRAPPAVEPPSGETPHQRP